MKLLTLTLLTAHQITANDLMGNDSENSDQKNSEDSTDTTNSTTTNNGPTVRHIGSTRNMIYELAELGENKLNFFSSKANKPGLVYPRDLIKRHGCYCHYEGCEGNQSKTCTKGISPRIPDFFGMPYKTKLDRNCHKIHKAHICLEQEFSECNDMRRNYGWRITDGVVICNASRNDKCQQALCRIDKEFAESVVEMVRSDPDEVRSWLDLYDFNDDAFDGECPRPPKVPAPLDSQGECCGLGLERAFYRRIPALSECCVDVDGSEEVRPLGMCF